MIKTVKRFFRWLFGNEPVHVTHVHVSTPNTDRTFQIVQEKVDEAVTVATKAPASKVAPKKPATKTAAKKKKPAAKRAAPKRKRP